MKTNKYKIKFWSGVIIALISLISAIRIGFITEEYTITVAFLGMIWGVILIQDAEITNLQEIIKKEIKRNE